MAEHVFTESPDLELDIALLLAEIGKSIATSIATRQIDTFLRKGTDVVDRAVRATCSHFPEIEGTESALQRWTSGETFAGFLERAHHGERDLDEEIIASFIDEGDFYLPTEEERWTVASEILSVFLLQLSAALYQSNNALLALANRIEVLNAERGSETRTGLADLKAEVSSLRAALVLQDALTEAETPLDPAHHEMAAKIDLARDLIKSGHVTSARVALEQLQNEAGATPDQLEFRIVTNLGACALADDDVDGARVLLERAYRLQPDNPRAIANASVAAQFGGDSARAVKLAVMARKADPRNSLATAVLLEELWKEGESEQLTELICEEDWMTLDRQCGLVLAWIYMRQSRFEEAVTLCRSLEAAHSEDAAIHMAVSESLINYVQAQGLPVGFTEESLTQLREAEAEATTAIDSLRQTELNVWRHRALVFRAVARALIGKTPEALRDLDEVLDETPKHTDAAFNKGLLLLDQNRPAEARAVFEGIEDSRRQLDAVAPLADACLRSGDAIATVKLLKDSFTLEHPEWEEIQRAETLSRAEAAVGNEDSVASTLEVALERSHDDPRLLALAAARHEFRGDYDVAEKSLLKALGFAGELDRAVILVKLGALYQKRERFAEAADYFHKVVGGVVSHPAAIPLLECLVHSERLREALDWARTIRESHRPAPRIAIEVEAQILDYIGDPCAALSFYEELCSRSDAPPADSVKLALAQFRCGKRETALETVSRINASELCGAPQSIRALAQSAQLKWMLGVADHLDDAYLARRYGLNDPTVHLGFVELFLAHDRDWVEPDSVGPGCAVRLKSVSAAEQWWHIVDEGEEPRDSYELRADDQLAQKLLGRRVGDAVIVEGIEARSYEITAIQSKFVRAYQQSIEEYSPRFPGDRSLSSFEVRDNDFTKIFFNIDKLHERGREADRMYRAGRLPFAFFCSRIGRSVLEVWHALTRGGLTRIRFGNGSLEESNRARELLCEADGIVLDTLALLTVYELGLGPDLRRKFQRVAVPQHVFDELRGIHIQAVMGPMPAGWLGKDDKGRYALTEISEEAWTKWQEFVGSVLEFAESFEHIASYRLLDADDIEKLVDVLTWAGASAVYAGDEQSTERLVLISDDLGLCEVGHSLGVGAVNTQALLSELYRSDLITANDYSSWIERLVLLNYEFVRIKAEDIVRRLEVNGYVTSEGTRAMLRTLEGPNCTENSAVSVGAEVIEQLVRVVSREQIALILSFVLATLQRGRITRPILHRFRDEIASRFRLDPLNRDQLLRTVDLHIEFSTQSIRRN